MRLLLDTHAFIWAVHQPDRLSPRVADSLNVADNEVLVSAATAWEIATKHRIGKLKNGEQIAAGFHSAIESLLAREVPISIHHGLAAGAFVSSHRDPFDRMLAAQAMIEHASLVTVDRAFEDFPVTTLW